MNVELYILGQLADIEQQDFVGEYNLANVGDLSKRLGSKTNKFTLPPTANNRAIFENANQTLSNTGLPYIMIPCQLLSDGVDMKFTRLVLNSSGAYGFKITLFDTSTSFFDLIKNKELKDLDLTHLNHHWSLDSLPLFDDYDSPLTYPVTDCQVDSPNDAFPDNSSNVYLGVLLPMINENYLIEKIVNERGYKLDNKVLSDGYFKDRKPVVPVGADGYFLDKNLESRYKIDTTLLNIPTGTSTGAIWSIHTIKQKERYYTTDFPHGSANFGGDISFPESVEFTFDLHLELFNQDVLPETIRIDLLGSNENNTYTVYESFTIVVPPNIVTPQILDYTGVVKCFQTDLQDFSQLQIRVYSAVTSNVYSNVGACTINLYEFKSLQDEVPARYTNANTQDVITYVTIANNLPKFTQAEFLKQYCLKYGSIIIVNDYKKIVTIRPYKDLFNLANAEDWSDRVDYTNKPEILYQVDKIIGEYLYGENMEDDPATEKPYEKPIGTDLVLDLGDVVKSEKLQLEYDASRTLVKPFSTFDGEIAHIPAFEGYEYIGSGKNICLMMREQTGGFTYKDTAVTGIGTNFYTTTGRFFSTYFMESANVFNLGFDNQLFEKFYQTISKAINDKPIIIRCYMRLGIDKIANFSGENPVYIKELDGYYIVNKITASLNKNSSVEVELIKIKL